ncbi:MAG: FG-GAP repeat domain-containing protein, partial [Planctomycetota bacterium]
MALGSRLVRAPVVLALLAATALMPAACGAGDPVPTDRVPAGVSPVAAPSGAEGGAFSVHGEDLGLRFLHDVGDGTLDNILEAVGSGGAVLDFDGDGHVDLYLVNMTWREGVSSGTRPSISPTNRLFRNRGNGTFEDVTDSAGVGHEGFGVAAAVGDYDGDGRVDLYVVNAGPNVLYRNLGDGTFDDVTEESGSGNAGNGAGAVFLDADGDGRLDLYVTNYLEYDAEYDLYFGPDGFPGPLSYDPQPDLLFRNQGDGTFIDVSAASGVAALRGRGMGVTALDADGDGDTDLFVA